MFSTGEAAGCGIDPALKDVSFNLLKEGSLRGDFGRNGVGKSTLLRLLAGDVRRSEIVLKFSDVLEFFELGGFFNQPVVPILQGCERGLVLHAASGRS